MREWLETHPFTVWFVTVWLMLVILTGGGGLGF